MELTPIKVPGNAIPLTKRRKISAPDVAGARSLRLKRNRKTRSCAMLESLPSEILEIILFACLNVDLPRSSPLLGAKLSCRYIYVRFILSIFKSSWERFYFPTTRGKDLDYNQTEKNLKSNALRCRWASLPVILEAKKIWIESLPDFYQKEHAKSHDYITANPEEDLNLQYEIFSIALNSEGCYGHFDVLQLFIIDNCAIGVQIPNRLLQGPWSDEDVKYLFWIIKSGARVGQLDSTSREVALIGLKNALMHGDCRVSMLLLWSGIFGLVTYRYRNSEANSVSWSIKIEGCCLLAWIVRHSGGNRDKLFDKIFPLARSPLPYHVVRETEIELSKLGYDHSRISYLMGTLMGALNGTYR
ncbi:hypothetical protein K3495_g380 [Podosphaera aphanis]|nr:hypothetical protein K3495_g380 [Podosphaera aphanis]